MNAWYEANVEDADFAARMGGNYHYKVSAAVVGSLSILFLRHGATYAMVEDFWRGIKTMDFHGSKDPRAVLVRRLISEERHGTYKSRDRAATLVIHAWNAWVKEKQITQILISPSKKGIPAISKPSAKFLAEYE